MGKPRHDKGTGTELDCTSSLYTSSLTHHVPYNAIPQVMYLQHAAVPLSSTHGEISDVNSRVAEPLACRPTIHHLKQDLRNFTHPACGRVLGRCPDARTGTTEYNVYPKYKRCTRITVCITANTVQYQCNPPMVSKLWV